uniref:ethanolamine kinase n=1 Tax=Parascaris univalens TaxID=6257 RepID=A0A915A4D7_PARUN
MPKDLPFFDIALSLTDDVKLMAMAKEILSRLKPTWHDENIAFIFFTTGITNKVFCATSSTANDVEHDERVIFRVFGRNTERIIDRNAEVENWLRLAKVGCAAPILARFSNGIVCGYLDGEPLTTARVREQKIVTEICRSLAKMHMLEPIDRDNVKPILFQKTEDLLENFSAHFESSSKQEKFDAFFLANNISLRSDYAKLQQLINPLKTRIVFCHNDLLIQNILYDSNTGVQNVDYSLCPSIEEKRSWIIQYLNFFLQHPPSTEDVEEMMRNSIIFEAAAHFFWSIWALVQSQNSSIDFDYLGYGILRYKMFRSFMQTKERV